jgi:hypothetical protein
LCRCADHDSISFFTAADLYGIDQLKDLCASTVRRSLTLDNAVDLLQASHDSMAAGIKEICLAFVVGKFEVISKGDKIGEMSHALLIECLQSRP